MTIERYLAELRRRGVGRDALEEVRAHLEDGAREVGEAEALARFGKPRVVARGLRRFPWPAATAAIAIGVAIGWLDSRPNWDDTGISAGVLFLGALAISWWVPRHAWRWALAVGAFIPLIEVTRDHNTGSLGALAFAAVGATVGSLVGRAARAAY